MSMGLGTRYLGGGASPKYLNPQNTLTGFVLACSDCDHANEYGWEEVSSFDMHGFPVKCCLTCMVSPPPNSGQMLSWLQQYLQAFPTKQEYSTYT